MMTKKYYEKNQEKINQDKKEENTDKDTNIINKEKNKETQEKDQHMQYLEKILLHDIKRIVEI